MADDGFDMVASVGDLAEGEVLGVETPRGERVCLVNVRGEICAVHDVCTHAEFPMHEGSLLSDGTLECVWHGARFDPRTGAATRGPAVDPLPTYAVRVENGEILVGRRKETG